MIRRSTDEVEPLPEPPHTDISITIGEHESELNEKKINEAFDNIPKANPEEHDGFRREDFENQ